MICTMRLHIALDDALVHEAMRYSEAQSKSALVEEALRTFIQVKAEEARNAEYWRRLDPLQDELQGLRFTESAQELVRADRDR